jgi:lipopolysaccharide export LptBFGC system permease protein LptF
MNTEHLSIFAQRGSEISILVAAVVGTVCIVALMAAVKKYVLPAASAFSAQATARAEANAKGAHSLAEGLSTMERMQNVSVAHAESLAQTERRMDAHVTRLSNVPHKEGRHDHS